MKRTKYIKLSKHEKQSGSTRVDWAEGLIEQLPVTHEGRNSWLLNYGNRKVAKELRQKDSRVWKWSNKTNCVNKVKT